MKYRAASPPAWVAHGGGGIFRVDSRPPRVGNVVVVMAEVVAELEELEDVIAEVIADLEELEDAAPESPPKNVRIVLAPFGIIISCTHCSVQLCPGLHRGSAGFKFTLTVNTSLNSGNNGRPRPPRCCRAAAARTGRCRFGGASPRARMIGRALAG